MTLTRFVVIDLLAIAAYLYLARVPVAAYDCDDIEVEEASKSVIEDKSNED